MGSDTGTESFPRSSSRSPGDQRHPVLFNPVHAGLQLLTDVLAHIPGPHQERIQPAKPSRRSPALATGSTAEAGLPAATTSAAPGHRAASSKPGSHSSGAITKEELGRATWTLLHGIAAQYPDHPSRQQKKDVKQLVRCAAHRLRRQLAPSCYVCLDEYIESLNR